MIESRLAEELADAGLDRLGPLLKTFTLPAIRIVMEDSPPDGRSKLGGIPDLPRSFTWPRRKGRPLDFLLQIELTEIQAFDEQRFLPSAGRLSFFYDLAEQPWGYDPADLAGFSVIYTPSDEETASIKMGSDTVLDERALKFNQMITLPHYGSRAYERLAAAAQMSDDETDHYLNFSGEFEERDPAACGAGNHHLFGHAKNIQNDMQLEAQLVTNGLYCGDSSGYEDPRVKQLESGIDDWMLLLQIDSIDSADLMWGDSGMLYFWIRRQDLKQLKFNKAWMTLQCC